MQHRAGRIVPVIVKLEELVNLGPQNGKTI